MTQETLRQLITEYLLVSANAVASLRRDYHYTDLLSARERVVFLRMGSHPADGNSAFTASDVPLNLANAKSNWTLDRTGAATALMLGASRGLRQVVDSLRTAKKSQLRPAFTTLNYRGRWLALHCLPALTCFIFALSPSCRPQAERDAQRGRATQGVRTKFRGGVPGGDSICNYFFEKHSLGAT